jgi:hypothetical protein
MQRFGPLGHGLFDRLPAVQNEMKVGAQDAQRDEFTRQNGPTAQSRRCESPWKRIGGRVPSAPSHRNREGHDGSLGKVADAIETGAARIEQPLPARGVMVEHRQREARDAADRERFTLDDILHPENTQYEAGQRGAAGLHVRRIDAALVIRAKDQEPDCIAATWPDDHLACCRHPPAIGRTLQRFTPNGVGREVETKGPFVSLERLDKNCREVLGMFFRCRRPDAGRLGDPGNPL